MEARLQSDDRCILPLGCTEQHAYLSLATDSILAERVSCEAAELSGVPVFPVLPYGVTPAFAAYPGTVSLGFGTYLKILVDVLDAISSHGFRRILIVNGHGGNTPARMQVGEWSSRQQGVRVIWHDWWAGPQVWQAVSQVDAEATHASWMENFPWTRLPGVTMPEDRKPMVANEKIRQMNLTEARAALGDGMYGGLYERSDEDMLRIWGVAVSEVRALLESGWVND